MCSIKDRLENVISFGCFDVIYRKKMYITIYFNDNCFNMIYIYDGDW